MKMFGSKSATVKKEVTKKAGTAVKQVKKAVKKVGKTAAPAVKSIKKAAPAAVRPRSSSKSGGWLGGEGGAQNLSKWYGEFF